MYSNSCGIVCVAKRQISKAAPCGKEKEQMKTITEITRQKPTPPQIRLAAYCRVSSDSSDQLHSFAAQIKYYSEYCKRHPEYKFVDIYADEGITGTSMEKRDDFRRMLRDCKKGLIDRIIVKSMSRFARNTEEMLTALRALEQMEVSVYFEEQGLDTKSMNSEMFATFPGMVAQQESVSISQNMRWSYKKRMESGEFNCCAPAYGFDLINGKLVINETEAAVIRRIFDLYLQGIGMQTIANILNDEGTLDVIKITRKLREINVDVYFEEQGIHSIDPASEFYITIYGSIAQSESENISANVKWGKAQSSKQGNVPFQCKHFLGYTKNADGEIEIVPEEAEIIREIYERYLSGESLYGIKCYLEEKGIPTPAGCSVWRQETIRSILSNEKYKGDAIINKTYVSDCISKRVKVNNGERNKYYIENNHPAIIDAGTFARVQEEIARRSGKPKVKQKGTKTELSRYSSKYALSELLICGECRTPYRRCTWTAKGKRKIVWRCINRLDYGKKYCHHSPSIEESLLQDAVMRAIMQTAKQNVEVLKTLKIHIGMGLTDEITEDKTLDIQIRIAEIDAEFQKMLKSVSAVNADGIDEERITELMNEKQRLTVQLEQYAAMRQKRESAKSRLDEIFTILDGLQNHPMEYDDTLVRQIIECVVVESKEKIKVVFIGVTEIEMTL